MSESIKQPDNTSANDKLDMQSPDLVSQNFEKLAELFPNCVTESANGKAIDFDLLKQELNYAVVEGNKERYRLEWPGKREAIVTANLPTTKTLRPVRNDSLDFDNTKNVYIEGDNLEAIKLLQEGYLGKIKMIYIDPPYNTGNDFIYKDNFAKDEREELLDSGQKNEYSQRLIANLETAGRYHSDWLSMIYPRLKLSRNLLHENGLIFISIDDNELNNLKKICDEIFGESNFLGILSWVKRNKPINSGDAKFQIQKRIEYVLVFCKSKNRPNTYAFNLPVAEKRTYTYQGKYGLCRLKDIEDSDIGGKKRDTMKFEILGIKPSPGKRWKIGSDEIKRLIELDRVRIIDGRVKIEIYPEDEEGVKYKPFWSNFTNDEVSSAEAGKSYLNELMSAKLGFDTVKPVDLITSILTFMPMQDGDIVLDYFSGTGTTAEGVLAQNSLDGIERKFIMVQFPEPCQNITDAYKAGYLNICEIGKERIRRAAKKIKEETGANIDYGFRVYRLDESNMQDVYYRPQELDQAKMDLFGDNVKPDRTEDDLLVQVMLDWGLPLSLKIEQANVAGKKVFKVAENSLFACFDKGVDEAFAKEIAKQKPLRIVFKDAGFKDDTAKTNVKQLLKQLSPETEMKVL